MSNAPSTKGLATMVVVVALGGALGTLLRDLSLRLESTAWYGAAIGGHGWASRVPWILMLINLVGVYLATVALRGPLARRDAVDLTRLLIITGFFGGFTSYSSLYVAVGSLWHTSIPGALLLITAAVASGVAVAWLGARNGPE